MTPAVTPSKAQTTCPRCGFEIPKPRRGRQPMPPEIAERIRAMRRGRMTLRQIAAQLNREAVPTPRGGAEWRPSSLQSVLRGVRRGR